MDITHLSSADALTPGTLIDRRDTERKVCRVRAMLELDDWPPITGKTIDLGRNGVALRIPMALERGRIGHVSFSLFINGTLEHLRAKVEVSNSVFLSTDVRVGFAFVGSDKSFQKDLAAFLR
jgi:hypothetical protein